MWTFLADWENFIVWNTVLWVISLKDRHIGWYNPRRFTRLFLLYPPHNEVVGGYIGFSLSVRPPIPRPSRITCLLCRAYTSGWIHFIFIHLTKQLQKVGRMLSFLAKFQNLNFWQFFKICNFDFVLFWLGIWCESLVCSVAVNYRRYKLIWKFRSIIDMDFSISIYQVSNFTSAIMG